LSVLGSLVLLLGLLVLLLLVLLLLVLRLLVLRLLVLLLLVLLLLGLHVLSVDTWLSVDDGGCGGCASTHVHAEHVGALLRRVVELFEGVRPGADKHEHVLSEHAPDDSRLFPVGSVELLETIIIEDISIQGENCDHDGDLEKHQEKGAKLHAHVVVGELVAVLPQIQGVQDGVDADLEAKAASNEVVKPVTVLESLIEIGFPVATPVADEQVEHENNTPAAEADDDSHEVGAVDASRAAARGGAALLPAAEQHHPDHVERNHEHREVHCKRDDNARNVVRIIAPSVRANHVIDEEGEEPSRGLEETQQADLPLHVEGVVLIDASLRDAEEHEREDNECDRCNDRRVRETVVPGFPSHLTL